METEQATLVILSPGFAKNEADSTCLPAVQNFVKALNAQFPLVKIAILAFDYPYISATWQWNNNTVTGFNGSKKRKLKKILKWISIWRKLNELKRKKNIENSMISNYVVHNPNASDKFKFDTLVKPYAIHRTNRL